jgi:hypothetical protein
MIQYYIGVFYLRLENDVSDFGFFSVFAYLFLRFLLDCNVVIPLIFQCKGG